MIERHTITRYEHGKTRPVEDELVGEQPLEIRVRGKAVAVTMRTPGQGKAADREDAELAAGFLLSEAVIRSADEVVRIEPCAHEHAGNIVNVYLHADVEVDFDQLTRNVFSSSSCGVCGKASIEALYHQYPPIRSELRIDAGVLTGLPDALRQGQACFDRTGALHAAGLFTAYGKPAVIREDVGRHNAVDKVLGHALFNRMMPLNTHVLMVSGRVSFEIVQKALAGGVPVIAAVSAPSSLAVELAEDAGITLLGFVRDGRMNIYTGGDRVTTG